MKFLIAFLLLISNTIIAQDGVRLYVEKPNVFSRETIIAFAEGATDGADNCCDALLFGGIINHIYTYNGTTAYVINTFAPLMDDKEIQLGLTINPDTGLFVLGINGWYGDTLHAQLIDNLVPGLHQFPYTFQAPASNNRFKVLFEYPMCIGVFSGCDSGLITIDNDDEGVEYMLIYGGDTMSYPSIIDTIQNLNEGTYTIISGSGESYTFGLQSTAIEASLQVSADYVWIVDSWIEFILTCTEPLTEVEWNFGDGITQIGDFNPVHQYTAPGIYTATVTLTSTNGCQKVIPRLITVVNVMSIPTIERTRIVTVDDRKWTIDGKQIE
jgi:hypothetical protein